MTPINSIKLTVKWVKVEKGLMSTMCEEKKKQPVKTST